MTARNTKVVQAAGDFHHLIGNAGFLEAKYILDHATPFQTSDGVFHDNADTGNYGIESFVFLAEFLPSRFFWGWRVRTSAGS